MKDGAVLECRKLHKDTVLEVFALKKGLPVDRTVIKPWEAQVPHQIFDILLAEKVLIEVV